MEPKWPGLTLYRFLFWNCVKLQFDSGMSVKGLMSEEPANSKRLCCSARYLCMDSDRGAVRGILSLAWMGICVLEVRMGPLCFQYLSIILPII